MGMEHLQDIPGQNVINQDGDFVCAPDVAVHNIRFKISI